MQILHHLCKRKTLLQPTQSHDVSRLSDLARFVLSLHNLLKSHQVTKRIESNVIFPGAIKLIFDHQEHTAYLVCPLHQLHLIDILLEVELHLQLHDDSIDELFMHFGHHQKRVFLQFQVD